MFVLFLIYSPFAYMDPLSCNFTYMFIKLFRDSLNEYTYAADLAGLLWELNSFKYGITVSTYIIIIKCNVYYLNKFECLFE